MKAKYLFPVLFCFFLANCNQVNSAKQHRMQGRRRNICNRICNFSKKMAVVFALASARFAGSIGNPTDPICCDDPYLNGPFIAPTMAPEESMLRAKNQPLPTTCPNPKFTNVPPYCFEYELATPTPPTSIKNKKNNNKKPSNNRKRR